MILEILGVAGKVSAAWLNGVVVVIAYCKVSN
jgi:hypothetical protein